MQDFSDNMLDILIEQSLRSGSTLRPGQKQQAWAALRERIAAESLAVEPAPVAPAKPGLFRSGLNWLIWMCLEESHYERAARQRSLASYPLALCGEPLGGGMWTTFRHDYANP
jgi:hypothetical protein